MKVILSKLWLRLTNKKYHRQPKQYSKTIKIRVSGEFYSPHTFDEACRGRIELGFPPAYKLSCETRK